MKTSFTLFSALLLFSTVQLRAQNSNNTLPTSGNVGIGTTSPNTKLQVCGKTVLDSSVVVKDSLNVEKNINAKQDIKVDGNVYVDGFTYTDKLITPRIVSPNGEYVAVGDSSIYFNYGQNRIYWNTSLNNVAPLNIAAKGLGIGGSISGGASAYAWQSLALGTNVMTDPVAEYSISIGRGLTFPNYFSNTVPNSMMVGFLTETPTFFVGPGTGAGTYGKVGINTKTPGGFFEVYSRTQSPYSFNIVSRVDNLLTRAFSVVYNNNGTDVENFLVYGNGTVYCREVFVKLGVLGDFVFDPAYNLMPYNELRAYLKKHRHLPGVPAEKEVQETGLNVGEMQALVLQKTEENTLYILDLNERLEKQEKEKAELEKENELLRQQYLLLLKRVELLEKKSGDN